MKRTRRTLPGTLAPGDAYAPSLFEDEHPAPPAPLALFATDTGRADRTPTVTPRCAVCDDDAHQADACPRGAAVSLFEEDEHAERWAGALTIEEADAERVSALHELAATGPSPFLRRKAAEALAALAEGDEDTARRHIDIITAQR
jgi:hypothetical protein